MILLVIFLLRDKAILDLEGIQSCICHRIDGQTEKAILFSVVHKMNGIEKTNARYWLPKSKIMIDGKQPVFSIDTENAKKIEIPDWLWKERKPIVDKND